MTLDFVTEQRLAGRKALADMGPVERFRLAPDPAAESEASRRAREADEAERRAEIWQGMVLAGHDPSERAELARQQLEQSARAEELRAEAERAESRAGWLGNRVAEWDRAFDTVVAGLWSPENDPVLAVSPTVEQARSVAPFGDGGDAANAVCRRLAVAYVAEVEAAVLERAQRDYAAARQDVKPTPTEAAVTAYRAEVDAWHNPVVARQYAEVSR